MRQWLLAIGTLLAGSAISSYADYVVIKVNLGYVKEQKDEARTAGAQPGGQGFGAQGLPGGRGPGGQPGGAFGGAPPGGAVGRGMRGGLGGPGGALGGPPGANGLGGQPPGFGPGLGQARGGAFTSRQTSSSDDEDEEETNPFIVSAVIEVDHAHLRKFPNLGQYHIVHKWGDTQIYFAPPEELKVEIYEKETVAQRFATKRREIKDDASDKVEDFIKLARWALEHGMLDQVDAMMEEVAKFEPKNATLATFLKVQADMKRDLTQDDPGIEWRDKLGDFKITNSKHYALLNDMSSSNEPQRWLDRLEQNYRGFFYWFALRNHALPVPTKRLVAALVQGAAPFRRGHDDIFDEVPVVEDGFFCQRENITVFAAGRLDQGYEALSKLINFNFKNINLEELFSKKPKVKGLPQNELARAETWVLLRRAMEEESQRAAITHEGTKQLLSAVGLWPRKVEVPDWLSFGIGSFFETPRGAFWPGAGAPNLGYHRNFQRWEADKKNLKFEHDSTKALKAVVTDRYFREIRAAEEKEKEKEALTGPSASGTTTEVDEEIRREKDLEVARARTLAWAVTYYLMKQRPEGVTRYIQELKSMPRDLEFDSDTLLLLFAKSFGLMDRADPSKIDENRLANLAGECFQFVRLEPLAIKDSQNESGKKETKPAGKRGQQPKS